MAVDAEVIEIGWTDVRLFPGQGWQIEDGPHSELCDVTCDIEPAAMGVHHIVQDMLVGKPEFSQRLPQLLEGVDYLAAHHAEFDSAFFPDKRTPFICTMKAAAAIWPDLPNHKNQTIRYAKNLVEYDDPKSHPSHRAGPDTYVTAHILLALLAEYRLEALLKVSKEPRRMLTIPFGKHSGTRFSDLPLDYLQWIVSDKNDLKEDVKFNARRELGRRGEG
ncbi:DUF3820 family protein [Aurantimonas sp. DM33-3]|nr:DUF3820 family protein [Aurantimonas sp. DM33-3]